MAEAKLLPYHVVDMMCNPGLSAAAGTVALKSYLCKTASNGGNDNATALLGALRNKKDRDVGPTLQALTGSGEFETALKGQGIPKTFVTIWDFMCRNKDLLKKTEIEVCAPREKGKSETRVVLRSGNVYDLYFAGNSDAIALQRMVADRFFGVDCIGFCANVLIANGEWDKYKGATPQQWPLWHCTVPVRKASDIKPLDFLLWDGHIAMIDWVWGMDDDKTVRVDVCQSSSGGPQCNARVVIKQLSTAAKDAKQMFKIQHRGAPAMPVYSDVFIMRRKGFFW
jgi:hypothetical protein